MFTGASIPELAQRHGVWWPVVGYRCVLRVANMFGLEENGVLTTMNGVTHQEITVVLRQAATEDHLGVAKMCRASGLDPWSREVFTSHTNRAVILATIDGEIAGAAKTHHHAQRDGQAPAGHYLGGVVVGQKWRRQGAGALLTEARLTWIWERSDRAFYFTNERNNASTELHQRFGFTPILRSPRIRGISADGEGAHLILYEAARPASGGAALSGGLTRCP